MKRSRLNSRVVASLTDRLIVWLIDTLIEA